MARIAALLILLTTAFACQFKAEEKAGALISGHQEVTNKFTVAVPVSKIYVAGEHLDFTLTFPYAVTVTNTPQLTLNIGGSTQYAQYVSGTTTHALIFRYTVQASDLDSDGITVTNSIDLAGGTLAFTGTNGAENCNVNLNVPSTTGVRIDTIAPNVSIVTPPANATYLLGMPLNFYVTFDEAVTITNTPRLVLTVGSTTRYANYVSGSGSSMIVFRYIVAASDLDANGVAMASSVDLNTTGTVKDSAGNDASLSFSAPNTTAVLVDGNTPYVTAVTPPVNGSYSPGSALDFLFTFSEPVNVTGTPRVALTIGATARSASYQSGTGTTQLTFRYIIQTGDLDLDGIVSASIFTLTAATIRDASMTNTLTSFVMPSLTQVLVTDSSPRINSFTITNATYYIGQTLNITAVYDQAVTITGSPRIPIAITTGGPVYATYVSGSGTTNIVYSYVVGSGVDDANGITLTTPMELNGGTIKNASAMDAVLSFTSPSTPSVRLSGIGPTVTSVTPPANATYLTGQNLDFVVNFSENVTVNYTGNINLGLTVGATPRSATFLSGSGTNALTFRYVVDVADVDTNGISVGTLNVGAPDYITDGTATHNLATVTFSSPDTTAVLVNATVPTITSVTPPSNATYILTQNLDFTVHFSEAVTVTGTPTLPLTVGVTSRTASFVSGSGTTDLVFRHAVQSNDVDTDGIALTSPIALSSGTIKSANGIDAALAYTSPNTAAILIDGDEPTVTSVSRPANAIYDVNDISLTFTVTFDQIVTVAGSNPRIQLNVGGSIRYATYTTGTGTNTLTFVNMINSADVDLDGIAAANSGNIDLNSATIQDANGNNANLSLNSPDFSKIFLSYPNMAAWWDIDDPTMITTATCGLQTCAAQVTDKTGSGYNLTQTGTPQPEYVSSGFGTGNRGYLQFDNANDYMNLSLVIPTIRTMVMVFQSEAAAMTIQDLFYSTVGGTTARVQITAAGALSYGGTQQAGWSKNGSTMSANATTGSAAIAASTRYILVVRFSGNQSPGATQRIGNTNFGGKIAEVLVFNNGTALSDSQLTPIISYLNLKHGAY